MDASDARSGGSGARVPLLLSPEAQEASKPGTNQWKATLARALLGFGLCVKSAILMSEGMPTMFGGSWLLIMFGFIPFIVAQRYVLPPGRLWAGTAAALSVGVFYCVAIGGIFFPVSDSGVPRADATLPFVLLVVLFAANTRHSRDDGPGAHLSAFKAAVVFVSVEFERLFIPQCQSWAYLSYAFYGRALLLQPVSIFGMLVLDFLIVAFNHAAGSAIVAALRVARPLDAPSPRAAAARVSPPREAAYRQRVLRCTGGAFGVWGLIALLVAAVRPFGADELRITGVAGAPRVDPAAGRAEFWTAWGALCGHVGDGVARGGGADLVVLAEAQLGFDPALPLPSVGWTPGNVSGLTAAAGGALVSLGYIPAPGAPPSVALLQGGAVAGAYHQNHGVSFVAPVPAPNYGVYDTPAGARVALSTAYDMDFLDTAQQLAVGGAQVIAVSSGDWAGASASRIAFSVMRAVENRVAVVKVDAEYGSVLVEASGSIVASCISASGSVCAFSGTVHLGRGAFLYSHTGDLFGWLCILAMCGEVLTDCVCTRRCAQLRWMRWYYACPYASDDGSDVKGAL